MKSLSFLLSLVLILIGQTQAQISVRVDMAKKTFISHEHVKAVVSITNNSGRPLRLSSRGDRSWVEFDIKKNNQRTITATKNALHGPTIIDTGATIRSNFDLSLSYGLTSPGNYMIKATVNVDEQNAAFRSNNAFFTVNNGLSIFKSRYGDPANPKKIREYNILTSSDTKHTLYLQILEPLTGKKLQTYALGEYLKFRKPQFRVDNKNHLHALFSFTPELWAHAEVGPNGKLLSREYLKPIGEPPKLLADNKGSVFVIGAVKHDAEAEKKKQNAIRNLTDRPRAVYQ